MKNREIKFRAWYDSKKEMHFFNLFMVNTKLFENQGGDMIQYSSIMQFTGLKDKNGKEVYEGDIVSLTRPVGNWTGRRMTTIHKIYFEEHICSFVLESTGNYTKLRKAPFYEYEVLGNIYENDFEKIKLAVEAVTPNEVQK